MSKSAKFFLSQAVLVILALVIGFFVGRGQSKPLNAETQMPSSAKNSVTNIRASGYKYINPLLDCEQSEADFTELKPFKSELENLVKKEQADKSPSLISVYFRDMNNGPWVGINETENFAPASLLKLPLMIAYFKLSETNPKFLDERIKVTSLAQLVSNEQFIVPAVRLEIGKSYSISELIERMIKYSDNDATQLLIEHADLSELTKVYKDFGLNLPSEGQPETQVTVRQYSGFLRLLFNGSYLTPADSEKAMELLSEVDFKDGLVAGVPGNISVAHKFGEREVDNQLTQLHDCGIVYYPKRPYLLCVMTRGKNEQDMAGVIKDVSALVYRQVDQQIQNND